MISTSPISDQSVHSSNTPGSVNPGVPTLRHHHHHTTMTYDPYLGTTNNSTDRNNVAKVPEFLRPLPKPARYNNTTNGIENNCTPLLSNTFQQQSSTPIRLNGIRPNNQQTRIPNPQQQKYLPPTRPILEEAVNLVHKKDYVNDEYRFINNTTSAQQYTPPSHYYTPSTAPMVTHPYTPIYFNNSISQVRPQLNNNTAYIHIPNTTISSTVYNNSPPKPGQSILKDTIIKPQLPVTNQLQLHLQQKIPFKVPSGKEGSLKHRILTRPVNENPKLNNNNNIKNKNNNGPLHPSGAHFARGSLIQLASGELRKIEDMRTEDFISAAEKCPALRLDPSTVVRITENSQRPQEVLITLSYGRHNPQQQVELEVSLEHPFFVYGKGWASISPERSLHNFDLPCHRLNVGDICISLSPRPSTSQGTIKQQFNSENKQIISEATRNQIQASVNAAAAAAELLRKRRWSAPDQFHSDDENNDGPPPSQRTKDNTGF